MYTDLNTDNLNFEYTIQNNDEEDIVGLKVRDQKIINKQRRVESAISHCCDRINLWRYIIKPIEDVCGNSVVSYFKFVSNLCNLNCVLLLLQLCIVILPYILLNPKKFEDYQIDSVSPASVENKFSKALICTEQSKSEDKQNPWDIFLNIIQGRGPFEKFPIFIGYFFNKTYFNLTANTFTTSVYNTPLAYLSAYFLCFLTSIVLVLIRSGASYRSYLIDEHTFQSSFGISVFTAIDYRIKTAKRITNQISELTKKLKYQYYQIQENRRFLLLTSMDWIAIYIKRIIINIFFIAFIILVYVTIYYSQKAPIKLSEYSVVKNITILTLLKDYIPTVVLSLINFIFPIINSKLILFENYPSSKAVGVCLKRVILVQAVSLLFFIETLVTEIGDSNSVTGSCYQSNYTKCWETYVGQQFYRMLVISFTTSVLVVPIIQTIRSVIYLRCKNKKLIKLMGISMFDIPTQGFQLIRSQTVCWLGLWFCPFLPLLLFVKLILLFFIQNFMFQRHLLVPAMEISSVAGGERFLYNWLLYSLAFVLIPMGYFFSRSASRGCTPFRIYDSQPFPITKAISQQLSYISEGLGKLWNFGTAMYTLVIVMNILAILSYIAYAKCKATEKSITTIKKKIVMEEKDFNFCLSQTVKSKEILEIMKKLKSK